MKLEFTEYILGVVVATFAWIGKRLYNDVDRLQHNKADKKEIEELAASLAEVRQEIQTGNQNLVNLLLQMSKKE